MPHKAAPAAQSPRRVTANEGEQSHRDKRIERALRDFPKLPDDAGISVPVTAKLQGCGVATVWRQIKAGKLQAIRVSTSMTRVTAGSLRQLLRGA